MKKLAEEPYSTPDLLKATAVLEKLVSKLETFEENEITKRYPAEIDVLESEIRKVAGRLYVSLTDDYNRIADLASLHEPPSLLYMAGQPKPTVAEYKTFFTEARERAVVILRAEIASIQECLDEVSGELHHHPLASQNIVPDHENNRKVFIVHGHDDLLKNEVARFLGKLGIEPIILHEQPNSGRTLIEKIEAFSDVGFAVVLMTADDHGGKTADLTKPRARQNVIMELGYFIGLLGRDKVAAINDPAIELPSDFDGVAYIASDNWQFQLAKELKAGGLSVDMNKAV